MLNGGAFSDRIFESILGPPKILSSRFWAYPKDSDLLIFFNSMWNGGAKMDIFLQKSQFWGILRKNQKFE